MKIYFVRHAQSNANVDLNILKHQTNMAVELSTVGILQATETGEYLANYLDSSANIKIWNSPYGRTRQTSKLIKSQLDANHIKYASAESIYLVERQFGLVDDVVDYHQIYKHESRHYSLHKSHNHDFFARPPLGESPFDMCLRLDTFLKTVLISEPQFDTHIIVSHGAAIRGLILMALSRPYEEYTSPNPYNASVSLIDENMYKGTIYTPSVVTS